MRQKFWYHIKACYDFMINPFYYKLNTFGQVYENEWHLQIVSMHLFIWNEDGAKIYWGSNSWMKAREWSGNAIRPRRHAGLTLFIKLYSGFVITNCPVSAGLPDWSEVPKLSGRMVRNLLPGALSDARETNPKSWRGGDALIRICPAQEVPKTGS